MAKPLRLLKTTVLSALLATVGTALAAGSEGEIVEIGGKGMLTVDDKFVPAKENMAFFEGDRVMALKGSKVVLQFDDGCRYTVVADTITTIEHEALCAAALASEETAAAGAFGNMTPAGAAIIGGAALAALIVAANNDSGGGGNQIAPAPAPAPPQPPLSQ